MFFSAKVLYPIFALFSVASVGFASPIAAPEPHANALVKRTDPVTSAVQTLSDNVLPLIQGLTSANAVAQVDAIVDVFAVANVDILGLVDVNVDIDVVVIVSLFVNILVKLFASLSVVGLLNLSIFAQIDAAVSACLNALVLIQADIAVQIGAGIPLLTLLLNVTVIVKLVLTVAVLGIGGLLGTLL